jgi:cellulose synthase (UDP-forming)
MVNITITRGVVVRFSTVAIFIVLSVASLIFSAYMFIEANSTYTFALACAFLSLSLFAGFFNVYASISYFRSYYYDKYIEGISAKLKPLRRLPTVAIVMAVFNEDPEEVKRNMTRLFEVDYPKDKIKYYMLDDSTVKETEGELERFCKGAGVNFVHRTSRKGYKGGAINNILKRCREEFLAIIDADEYLVNDRFLKDLLPYFEDKRIAFVQTEKRADRGTFFSEAVDLFDAFFFKFIQPHRALNNTALFAGSCGVIRKSALDEIGGFPEYVIEDTFFSLESDLHNFKSLYVPKVYALGRPMETYTALVKQQRRYNYGDTQFIKYYAKKYMESKKAKPWSTLDYLSHGFGLNYLSIVLISFTVLSVFVSFSTIPFAHMTIKQLFQASYISRYLEIFGGAAFVLSMIAPVILTKVYFGSVKKGFMIFVLNFALAVARAQAAGAAILKKDPFWKPVRTNDTAKHNLRYAIMNTKVEIAMSAALLSLGALAFTMSNIAGSIWLSTYGVLYLFATALIYKYG